MLLQAVTLVTFESVDEEEYEETVRLAETVLLWAEKIIQ